MLQIFRMAKRLLLAVALVTTPPTNPLMAQPGENAEDARLAKLFQTYLDEEFRIHPLFATQQGNHDFDDQLDDLSPEAQQHGSVEVCLAMDQISGVGKGRENGTI